MMFLEKNKSEDEIRNRIFAAFPENLRNDVDFVMSVIEKELFVSERMDYNLQAPKHVFTLSNNEKVSIPYRIWIDDYSKEIELTPVQQRILHCIYSRSTNGYLREKHIKCILEDEIPFWAFPYVLKLCDEYVMEILEVIYDKLNQQENDALKSFCQMNISYFSYSHTRMISYWDCFYRDRCYKFKDYVGRKLYRECFGYSRRLEKIIRRTSLQRNQ